MALRDGLKVKNIWGKFFKRKKSQYISIVTSRNPLVALESCNLSELCRFPSPRCSPTDIIPGDRTSRT